MPRSPVTLVFYAQMSPELDIETNLPVAEQITERLGLPMLLRSGSTCGRITQLLIGFLAVICRDMELMASCINPGGHPAQSANASITAKTALHPGHSGTTQLPCFGLLRYKQFGLGKLWPPFSNR